MWFKSCGFFSLIREVKLILNGQMEVILTTIPGNWKTQILLRIVFCWIQKDFGTVQNVQMLLKVPFAIVLQTVSAIFKVLCSCLYMLYIEVEMKVEILHMVPFLRRVF